MNESDFAQAVTRFLEGQLSPPEEEKLLKAIQSDPQLRELFIAHVRTSVRLDAAYHTPRDPRLVERTKALLSAADRGQPLRTLKDLQRRIDGRARARGWIRWAAAAAGVLITTLLVFKLLPSPPEPSEARPEIGVRPKPPPPPLPPPPLPEEPPREKPVPAPVPVEPPKEKPPETVTPLEKPRPEPVPKVQPEAPPPKPEAPRVPVETKVAAAKIESLTGEAFLSSAGGRKPLRAGQDVLPGEGVQTGGANSGAAILFPDRTRLEVGPNTIVRAFFDHEAAGPGAHGKRVTLDRGSLRAQVARQPKDQPMSVLTPHAEARVIGTTLRMLVGDRKDGSTRLEVSEGKVQFKRAGDELAVDVTSGHYAVAMTGPLELVAWANPLVIDLNDFGNGRDAKAADGPVRRLYRDESIAATGGVCVAAPGVGTTLEGTVPLTPGSWHLWIRYRDTDQGPVSFQVGIDGRILETIAGEGFLQKPWEKWNWRRVTFESKAKTTRVALRSNSEALRYDKSNNTYVVVNRWDSIILTRDPQYRPD